MCFVFDDVVGLGFFELVCIIFDWCVCECYSVCFFFVLFLIIEIGIFGEFVCFVDEWFDVDDLVEVCYVFDLW